MKLGRSKRQTVRLPLYIVSFLLVFCGLTSECAQGMFLLGPYPQSAQIDSVIISWKTTTPTTQNEVHWGRDPTLGNVTKENSLFGKTKHTVKLEGLTTGQNYFYTVVSDHIESALYTFWTVFPSNSTVRFVAYGDSQGVWDSWQTVLLVSQTIEKEHPVFVLKPGDLVDDGTNATQWIDFFHASPFLHNSTLYPVLGNHEQYSFLFFSYFSLPNNECWYSFDNGPVHLVGLDSNSPNRYRFRQFLWLVHDLRTHHQPFTIVYFHHPVYSSSEHGNTTLLQKIWAPVFERCHVDIVFNGHDHNYEHSRVNGVVYIVTGGGGSPLYDNGQSPWTVYSEKTYHYCLLTVNSSTLLFEAKKPDGLVFDSFILTT